MKNYWLLIGGISIGIGVAYAAGALTYDKPKTQSRKSMTGFATLGIAGGTFLAIVAIKKWI
jgi:hypothetical protein